VSVGKVVSKTSEKSAPIHDKVSKGPHVLRGLQGEPRYSTLMVLMEGEEDGSQ